MAFRHQALALGIVANLMGGATYVAQKVALGGFPPATVILLRVLIAVPALFLIIPKGWAKNVTRADWYRLAIIGSLGMAAPHLIGVYGLRDSASLNAAILIGMEPIAIALLSSAFLGERILFGQIAGIVLAFVGAIVVVTGGDLGSIASDVSSRGNLLLAIAGALWAIYTIAAKPTLERVSPIALAAVTHAIALPFLLPFALLELPQLDPERALSFEPIAAVIALGVLVSVVATVLWNLSLESLTATQMGALVFVQPIAGGLLGLWVGDPLPAALIVGSPLVLAGIYLTQFPPKAPGITSGS